MPYRIKLSDGVDTVNLYDGSDSQVREGAFGLPVPVPITSFIGNPTFDGNRLARSRRGNRTISMSVKIVGSSLSDLRANISTIHRLLDDAEKRNLSGYGSQLYLEYQWADNINESVFYDVLRGDLALPAGFQSVVLDGSFTVIDARLSLICKPFGRFIEQDIAQETLENEQDGADVNYQDIAASNDKGDVPAKLYLKIAQTGATGSEKIWIAKRSGIRQTDDLFFQGEDEDSSDDLNYAACGPAVWTYSEPALAAASAGVYRRLAFNFTTAACNASQKDKVLSRHNYIINDIPRGQFQVLVRVRVEATVGGGPWQRMGWGFGWTYGDKSYTPSVALDEMKVLDAEATWQILDLGVFNIPPIAESDFAITNVYTMRIYMGGVGQLDNQTFYTWDLDYIFLLPIDEGVVIIDGVAAADIIAIDGITDPPNVFIIDAVDRIEDFPDYVGNPFKLGREGTRIYMIRDDVPAVTFQVDTKFRPRFMVT